MIDLASEMRKARSEGTDIATLTRRAGKASVPGADRPGPTRHDDQWAMGRNGWGGMSFEEWGDLSIEIPSPVNN